ncbi:MAG TPA: D-alanine--D-alanine ligase [Candidatus Paceibacterota bacterium]|jgi:D-alanine-D-alanine ligase|nr:D-alanine--D-alanine ligase [Candidatus Paceibacterota bacterium]|tara:strand:+ start:1746 stop:2702 length:957 start_codon:yes stop_codon:yes gene_type:complete
MIKVGVLRGGPSSEYEVSLRTGQSILDNFSDEFEVKDILVDKNGDWFLDGFPVMPEKAVKKFNVFFNCLHGAYGEDGKVQQLLDSINAQYTGSGIIGSALAMNKFLAKRTFVLNGIRVPEHMSLRVSPDLNRKLTEIFRTWTMPIVVKPVASGSSIGVSLVNDFHDLQQAVASAFNHSAEIMVEEYIRGREATCGVVENFRSENLYALLPVEIVKPSKLPFSDYDAKYSGESEEIIPGRFSKEEKEEIQRLAKLAHQVLGLRHYSQSDFIVSPHGVYLLEVNTLPRLTEKSLYPKSLEAIGSSLKEFSGHLVNLALNK